MICASIQAVGLAAPGFPDWASAAAVLRGETPFQPADLSTYAPQLLPPNERRRATPVVRMAFRAAEEAVRGRDASALATVFATSDGDMAILHRVCAALATPQKFVSPTDFHNSVHNAAAGYWGIGIGARAPSTTITGYDGSFALGLVEAVTQVATVGRPVLLVVFDVPAAEPLLASRPMGAAASCALWLGPAGTPGALGQVTVRLTSQRESEIEALEAQRVASPALRALPLLRLLARHEAGSVVLPCSGGRNLEATLSF